MIDDPNCEFEIAGHTYRGEGGGPEDRQVLGIVFDPDGGFVSSPAEVFYEFLQHVVLAGLASEGVTRTMEEGGTSEGERMAGGGRSVTMLSRVWNSRLGSRTRRGC